MTGQPTIRIEVVILSVIFFVAGLVHIAFAKRVADFYTNNWPAKAWAEEVQKNQRVRPTFAKWMGYIIIFIGIWLGLTSFGII
jgi:hypothetical protein